MSKISYGTIPRRPRAGPFKMASMPRIVHVLAMARTSPAEPALRCCSARSPNSPSSSCVPSVPPTMAARTLHFLIADFAASGPLDSKARQFRLASRRSTSPERSIVMSAGSTPVSIAGSMISSCVSITVSDSAAGFACLCSRDPISSTTAGRTPACSSSCANFCDLSGCETFDEAVQAAKEVSASSNLGS